MIDTATAIIFTLLSILLIGGALAIADLYSRIGALELITYKTNKQKKAE